LKTKGSAEFACYGPNVQGKEYLYRGTLELVSKEPEEVSVLVNQKPVRLRTIHAKGRLKAPDGDWWSSLVGFPAEYWLLDDADNPICLRFKFGSGELDVIKISVRNQERAIEESLEREGKARIYGVHFDFASATIRPQSEPVLQEIASALRRHPEWTLRVEGHTDSIGDAEGNQALSLKRAEAVRRSLIEQFAIAPGRLGNSAGYGQTRPIDTNDTLAGRALNRRVELVRP
jgi:outer membrane protein OmpA-like peptidoglycan-associated protein